MSISLLYKVFWILVAMALIAIFFWIGFMSLFHDFDASVSSIHWTNPWA